MSPIQRLLAVLAAAAAIATAYQYAIKASEVSRAKDDLRSAESYVDISRLSLSGGQGLARYNADQAATVLRDVKAERDRALLVGGVLSLLAVIAAALLGRRPQAPPPTSGSPMDDA